MNQTTTTIPTARLRALLRMGLIVGLALLGALPSALAKSRVPANIQAAIFVRVLESDRAFNPRSDQTTIGLLFKAGEFDSMQKNMATIQAFSAFEGRALGGGGLRLAYRAIPPAGGAAAAFQSTPAPGQTGDRHGSASRSLRRCRLRFR